MRTSCECSFKFVYQNILPDELVSPSIDLSHHSTNCSKKSCHLKRTINLQSLLRSFFSVLKVSGQFETKYQDVVHFVVVSGNSTQDHLNLGIPLLMRYPDFLNKYTLLPKKIIGKGSSGTIHLASSKPDPTQLYAIKIFNKCKSKSLEEYYLSHLTSEFLIGVSLHHSNIVQTYELVRCGSSWFEIMEYCTGGDLLHSIHRHLPASLADLFFIELISGVYYLHSLGIAHCDLKPENVLISSENHIKIADFGASCLFSNTKFLTHDSHVNDILNGDLMENRCFISNSEANKSFSNIPPEGTSMDVPKINTNLVNGSTRIPLCQGLCGSIPYTPPEVLALMPYNPAPVDIWALGILYLVMTFHRVPWNQASETQDERYRRYLTQRIKFDPISRLPAPMAKLLCKMLEPDPSLRITIDQLISDPYIQNMNKDQ